MNFIYDAHIHVGKTEIIPWSMDLKDTMLPKGVTKAVVIPQISKDVSITEMNKALINHPFDPLKFHKLLFFDHKDIPSFISMIEKKSGIWGIKFHPSYSQMTIMDFHLRPMIEAAECYDLPILVHCGCDPKSRIDYLLSIAKLYPHIKFVAAHLGGGVTDLAVRAIELMSKSKLSNLYTDLSAIQHSQLMGMAYNYLGADRILFGSDEPYCSMNGILAMLEYFILSGETMDKILYKNAEIVYG